MPRRNNRERYEPLDLTIPTASLKRRPAWESGRVADRHEEVDRAERVRRQAQARAQQGIDWVTCVVPGCGNLNCHSQRGFLSVPPPNRRNPMLDVPLCIHHAAVVWQMMAPLSREPAMVGAIAEVARLTQERNLAEREREHKAWLANLDGQIYFIRLNDLIKVGWTRDLYTRVKQYGASAELLVHYAATRDDETLLHRNLKPARAKGREWYHDGPTLRLFIDKALKQHGSPTLEVAWTLPKKKSS